MYLLVGLAGAYLSVQACREVALRVWYCYSIPSPSPLFSVSVCFALMGGIISAVGHIGIHPPFDGGSV